MSRRLIPLLLLVPSVLSTTRPTPTPATPAPLAPTPTALATTPTYTDTYVEEPWFPIRSLVLECFPSLSWPCAQRKLLVYVDQLNRARRVRVIGDLLTLIKVRPDTTPPITEALLSARHIQDQDSLSHLLELVADRFMDSHVLRLSLPAVEGGRVVLTPLDVSFSDPNSTEPEGFRQGRDGKGGGKKKKGGKKKMKGGKKMMKMMMAMGKKGVEMMGKMIMMKMMMIVPIAMKKSMIGGMAGLMSMGMMKYMLIQKIITLLKQKLASCGGGGGGGGGGYGGGDFGGGGYGGGGDECGASGGGGGGYGGGGGGWDRTYATNTYSYPYNNNNNNNNNNQPYSYYNNYYTRQQQTSSDWSLWKK